MLTLLYHHCLRSQYCSKGPLSGHCLDIFGGHAWWIGGFLGDNEVRVSPHQTMMMIMMGCWWLLLNDVYTCFHIFCWYVSPIFIVDDSLNSLSFLISPIGLRCWWSFNCYWSAFFVEKLISMEKTVLICSDSLDLPSYHILPYLTISYHSTEGFCPRIGLFLDGNRPMASCRFSLAEGGVTFIFQMICLICIKYHQIIIKWLPNSW